MADIGEQLKLGRMAAVEEWRSKSFALGGPLGNVLARSYDLIHTVIRNGVTDEMTVGYALESLTNERALAMNRDVDKDDPIRHLVYGLTESMGSMLETIREGLREQTQTAESAQVDDPPQAGVSEHNDDGLPLFKEEEEALEDVHDEAALLIAKEEQMELHVQDQAESAGHEGQEAVVQPTTSANLNDSQDDSHQQDVQPTTSGLLEDEEEEDEEAGEMSEDEDEEEEDKEPCTSEQADQRGKQSRKRRRAFIDDEDEDDKDDAYSGESDTEQSSTRDSRLRPRRNIDGKDGKRRSSRLCTTGPKIYVDPDDNGQVTLSRRPEPVKSEDDEEENEAATDDHSCGQCDRKFNSARALATHSRVHNVLEYPASSSGEDDDDFIDDRDVEGEEEEVEEPVPWRLRVRERVTKTNKFIR